MPDNWSFVAAAYALAAIVLGAYWRMLVRKERELRALRRGTRSGKTGTPNGTTGAEVRSDSTGRSHSLPRTGHPRPEPGERHSLP